MGLFVLLSLAILGLLVFGVKKLFGRARIEPDPRRRRVRVAVAVTVAVAILAALIGFFVAVRNEQQAQSRPIPTFPSLATSPDPTLQGTVAYISEAKNPAVKQRQACARIVAAAGGPPKDVLCWAINSPALATAVWRDDGKLLVTAFNDTSGKRPAWGKIVDIPTGHTENVAASELGVGARPSVGASTNPAGEHLVTTGKDGNATITLTGPTGARTILSVTNSRPSWGIQSGPVWSPGWKWVLTWDGTRLLLTTVDKPTTTRVLVDEASGGAYDYQAPNFSITPGPMTSSAAHPATTPPTGGTSPLTGPIPESAAVDALTKDLTRPVAVELVAKCKAFVTLFQANGTGESNGADVLAALKRLADVVRPIDPAVADALASGPAGAVHWCKVKGLTSG
ncbi:MAG TPA: hypothetical protein VNC61_08415 [Acidimicrobiales bacterium]|nr:hypothetical protein [Acidimicrobiales bacterium]